MQTIKFILACASCILASQISISQSLAVNTDGSSANTSAILDVKSTTKGLLIPRMLKSERNLISLPATGLMVFQNGPDSIGFYYYNGSSWDQLSTGTSPCWSLTGNSGTSTTNNFIGTIDNKALRFRVFNTWAGQLDNITKAAFFGMNAGLFTTGLNNVAIGSNALWLNGTGAGNTAVGTNALSSNLTGTNNTAIGYGADVIAPGITNATAIGYNATVSSSNSIVLGNGSTNVGIGTTAPNVLLHVRGTANFFTGSNTHTGFFYNATSNFDGIELVANSGTDAFASIQRGDNGYCLHLGKRSSAVNQGLLGFYVNGTDIGHVDCDVAGTNVFYYTTSDQRLKENIVATRYGLESLLKIKVADYNYIAGTKKTMQTGFLAQQLYDVYPTAVKKGGADPKTDPWTIDYGRLTPILVKSVQDQQQLINAQNEKINKQQEEIRKLNEKVEVIIKMMNQPKVAERS